MATRLGGDHRRLARGAHRSFKAQPSPLFSFFFLLLLSPFLLSLSPLKCLVERSVGDQPGPDTSPLLRCQRVKLAIYLKASSILSHLGPLYPIVLSSLLFRHSPRPWIPAQAGRVGYWGVVGKVGRYPYTTTTSTWQVTSGVSDLYPATVEGL